MDERKVQILVEVLLKVSDALSSARNFIKGWLEEICSREKLLVEEVIYCFLVSRFRWRNSPYVALWCSGYHYCTTSFSQFWSQILRRLKPWSRLVRDLRWWDSLTMVRVGNKAKTSFVGQPFCKNNSSSSCCLLVFSNENSCLLCNKGSCKFTGLEGKSYHNKHFFIAGFKLWDWNLFYY